MRTGMSPSNAFISLITYCIITIYYSKYFARTSLRKHLSPRRPDEREFGPYRQQAADKSSTCTGSSMLQAETSRRVDCGSCPPQTQQRWAERPVYLPSPLLIIPASSPTLIPPPILFHCSAHRYCAWNFSLPPSSTPSLCFPSRNVEAIELIKLLPEVQLLESLIFLVPRSIRAHGQVQWGKQGRCPVPIQNSPPARAVRIGPPEGWGIRNFVKTLNCESLRRGGFQPGAPIFTLSFINDSGPPNRLHDCLPIFHPYSSASSARRYMICPSRARCRQAGGL
jgi:hypothetical protein